MQRNFTLLRINKSFLLTERDLSCMGSEKNVREKQFFNEKVVGYQQRR